MASLLAVSKRASRLTISYSRVKQVLNSSVFFMELGLLLGLQFSISRYLLTFFEELQCLLGEQPA
jgi:hypothetical protein